MFIRGPAHIIDSGSGDKIGFDHPAGVDPNDLNFITVVFKSVQLTGDGHVLVQLQGPGGWADDYYSTSRKDPGPVDGGSVSSHNGLIAYIGDENDGLHGHMFLTRQQSTPGNTDLWVSSLTCRLDTQRTVNGGGNGYFAGRLQKLRVKTTGGKFKSGVIAVLYA